MFKIQPNTAPQERRTLIPADSYATVMNAIDLTDNKEQPLPTKADPKPAKLQHFRTELEISEGPYKGRKLIDNINVLCGTERGREFAQKRLATYATLAGFTNMVKSGNIDTPKLVGKTFFVDVAVKATGPGGAFRNEVANIISEEEAKSNPHAF